MVNVSRSLLSSLCILSSYLFCLLQLELEAFEMVLDFCVLQKADVFAILFYYLLVDLGACAYPL